MFNVSASEGIFIIYLIFIVAIVYLTSACLFNVGSYIQYTSCVTPRGLMIVVCPMSEIVFKPADLVCPTTPPAELVTGDNTYNYTGAG